MGRKNANLTAQKVRKYARLQMRVGTIAKIIGCDESGIRQLYMDVYRKGKAEGKLALHEAQMKAAKRGNPTMLIWMGKAHLNQKETTKLEHTGKNGGPITNEIGIDLDKFTTDELRDYRRLIERASAQPTDN